MTISRTCWRQLLLASLALLPALPLAIPRGCNMSRPEGTEFGFLRSPIDLHELLIGQSSKVRFDIRPQLRGPWLCYAMRPPLCQPHVPVDLQRTSGYQALAWLSTFSNHTLLSQLLTLTPILQPLPLSMCSPVHLSSGRKQSACLVIDILGNERRQP